MNSPQQPPSPQSPQPQPGGGAPSSSEEGGRGNSGEGKDPPEGLYPSSQEHAPSAPGRGSDAA